MILEVRGLTKKFGGLVALNNFNLELGEGEIVGLIGPNGAGKTTFVNCVTGVLRPNSGEVFLEGVKIPHRLSIPERWRRGLGRTFQIPQLFKDLTVADHIRIPLSAIGLSLIEIEEEVNRRLDMVGMKEKKDVLAGKLTFGEQRKLELIRAFTHKTKVLFLDEILAGLSEGEVNEVFNVIRYLREHGITICWIEHRLEMLFRQVERVVVLESGIKIFEGRPKEAIQNERVIKAYIGQE